MTNLFKRGIVHPILKYRIIFYIVTKSLHFFLDFLLLGFGNIFLRFFCLVHPMLNFLPYNTNHFLILSLNSSILYFNLGIVPIFISIHGIECDNQNSHDVDTWMFFKWIFKTACAVLIVTNTWNIVMGVFEAAQSVVNSASGIIISDTSLTFNEHIAGFEAKLLDMEVWSLLGLWLESVVVHLSMWALTICIFIICYGRMIEIYCVTSIAPIPMATMANREWGQMGQNYLRSLLALGFQGFLIIVCVAIYAVLIQNIVVESSVSAAIWTCMGYTVLLCFTLFKTSSLARSLFHAH